MLSRSSRRQEAHQRERLLKLFWNRSEVKREVTGLRRERESLLETVREQDERLVHAREQLEGLERILTVPRAAANAMVYFQLRHLWQVASERLEQCAAELETQWLARERRRLQQVALAKRQRRLSAVKARLGELEGKRQALGAERQRLNARLHRWPALTRWVRGPRLRRHLAGIGRGEQVLDGRIRELKTVIRNIRGEALPEPVGLGVEHRRLVNVAAIALAQQLVVHFSADELAGLARQATECAVGDMEFGDRSDCDLMVATIKARLEALQTIKSPDLIRGRVERLRPTLRYRDETDTSPVVASVESIELIHESDSASGRSYLPTNVLVDDYWNLLATLR